MIFMVGYHFINIIRFIILKSIFMTNTYVKLVLILLIFSGCNQHLLVSQDKLNSDQEKAYWYNNSAEISSYKLTQARYGELREGEAVMVFVTEPFSPSSNTKADRAGDNNVPVLKLNFTKKFLTGIYPYSMMTSSFYPLNGRPHSLKVSSSSQEWCGHTFMKLKNKNKFEIEIDSYFENESAVTKIKKEILEDDIWSMIRVSPLTLPTGNFQMIPSFFYLRLMHKPIRGYICNAKLDKSKVTTTYTVTYPNIQRTKSIVFDNQFPHRILSWEESYPDGFGSNKLVLVTKGELINNIKSAYWTKNRNSDVSLRKELNLK